MRSKDDSLRRAVAGLVAAAPSPPPRRPIDAVAIHVVRDGRVVLGLGLPFGHARAAELEGLIDAARAAGASGVRTAPGRVLLFVGLAPTAAEDLRAAAARLGFVIRPDDPRRFVVACAGAPICGSATVPAREIAAAVAATAAPLLDGSVTVHLSGCPKGCAHPNAATLTFVGTDDGCGLVVGGSARDRPAGAVAADAVPAAVGHVAAEMVRARRPGETSADVLARIGAAQVAAIVAEAHHV
jgi:precorrin-3B synthase